MLGHLRRNKAERLFDKECSKGFSATNRPSRLYPLMIRAFNLPLLATEKTYRKMVVAYIRNGKRKR
jgi:hypothetical protein